LHSLYGKFSAEFLFSIIFECVLAWANSLTYNLYQTNDLGSLFIKFFLAVDEEQSIFIQGLQEVYVTNHMSEEIWEIEVIGPI